MTSQTTADTTTAPYGWLCDSDTTDRVRPATEEETRESMDAGHEGHIRITDNGEMRRVYLEQ